MILGQTSASPFGLSPKRKVLASLTLDPPECFEVVVVRVLQKIRGKVIQWLLVKIVASLNCMERQSI